MSSSRSGGFVEWIQGNWWLLLAFFAAVALWINAPMALRLGEDSVTIADPGRGSAQSLHSLDALPSRGEAPAEAGPAGAARAPGAPAGASSSLYRAPGAADGEPLSQDGQGSASGAPSGGGGSLASALERAAGSAGRNPSDGGWGGEQARTGLTPPRPRLESLPSRSGSQASSSAEMTVVKSPFGLGGAGSLEDSKGPGLGANPRRFQGRGSFARSLEALKGVEKASVGALASDSEKAKALGQKSFDASSLRASSLVREASGGGIGVGEGEGVPGNLKANDPESLSRKEIEVPAVSKAGEVKASNNTGEQVAMMLMMMMMGGVLGPAFSSMAPVMMMGMSMSQSGG